MSSENTSTESKVIKYTLSNSFVIHHLSPNVKIVADNMDSLTQKEFYTERKILGNVPLIVPLLSSGNFQMLEELHKCGVLPDSSSPFEWKILAVLGALSSDSLPFVQTILRKLDVTLVDITSISPHFRKAVRNIIKVKSNLQPLLKELPEPTWGESLTLSGDTWYFLSDFVGTALGAILGVILGVAIVHRYSGSK